MQCAVQSLAYIGGQRSRVKTRAFDSGTRT